VVIFRELGKNRGDLVHVNKIECHLEIGRVPEPLDLEAHDRMGRPVLLVEECLSVRESLHGPPECQFHGAIVVPVDPVVVCRPGTKVDARQDHQRVDVTVREYSLFDRVGDRFCHRGLDRAEHLPDLDIFLQRDLGDDQRRRFCEEVWPDHGKERRVAGRKLGEGVCKRRPDRPVFVADQKVDMGEFRTIAYECFTDKIHGIPFSCLLGLG